MLPERGVHRGRRAPGTRRRATAASKAPQREAAQRRGRAPSARPGRASADRRRGPARRQSTQSAGRHSQKPQPRMTRAAAGRPAFEDSAAAIPSRARAAAMAATQQASGERSSARGAIRATRRSEHEHRHGGAARRGHAIAGTGCPGSSRFGATASQSRPYRRQARPRPARGATAWAGGRQSLRGPPAARRLSGSAQEPFLLKIALRDVLRAAGPRPRSGR